VAGILDYNARTSSREAYASPTRGAQGNAMKTLLAMPFALDGQCSETVIESQGVAHRITFSIDPIRQEPRLVRVCEDSSILDDAQAAFLRIAEDLHLGQSASDSHRPMGPRRSMGYSGDGPNLAQMVPVGPDLPPLV